jgi:phosphomannomutase
MKTHNKKLFIFDLDGTLTESKSYLQNDMASALIELFRTAEISVISGCSYKQMCDQFLVVLKERLDKYNYLNTYLRKFSMLPMSGSSLYGWEDNSRMFLPLYNNELTLREKAKIIYAFDKAIADTNTTLPTVDTDLFGNIEEDRGGQVTFSLLGQKAPLELKLKFDSDFSKRKKLQESMQATLDEFIVNLGGTTSIDVTRKSIDKAHGITKLLKHARIDVNEAIFFGDSIFPGGNDWSVKQLGLECVNISNPGHMLWLLREIIRER